MSEKRKICVVTGTRADYGLLYWLIHEIDSDPQLKLQLIVTGSHLSPEHNLTYQIIERDGFKIDEKVDIQLGDDSPAGISRSIGLAISGIGVALENLRPDVLVVLGDRYEILAATTAALVARIPVGHIHGGESTEGLIDEAIRHSITKMSHLHFVVAETYRERVIQLGEDPEKIFNYGAPGLDNLTRLSLPGPLELEERLSLDLTHPVFLVTYHPVTLSMDDPSLAMGHIFSALDKFPEAKIIFTGVNADTRNKPITDKIEEFVAANQERSRYVVSLGQKFYLSALKHSTLVLGNSSSGIIEAPSFKTPTINLGDRQRGRLRANSVIDCAEDSLSIVKAIRQAMSEDFRKELARTVSPFGQGNSSSKIKNKLKTANLDGILMKRFYTVVS
jgi:UDP-hydrolysing UDP-N-acetyl-D-glucosamine 2-epimerase